MIRAFFYQGHWAIALACVAVTAGLALLAYGLVFRSRIFAAAREKPVVAPYFSGVSALFALFLSFNAARSWDNDAQAHRAAVLEGAAAARIAELLRLSHPEPRAALAPLDAYLSAVIAHEWGPRGNARPSRAAVDALLALDRVIWQAQAQRLLDPTMTTALERAVEQLVTARATRTQLTAAVGDPGRWVAMLFLALAAMIGMAMSHADRPATARIAMTVFAAAVASGAAVTAMYESPYTGLFAVGPERLAMVLERLRAP